MSAPPLPPMPMSKRRTRKQPVQPTQQNEVREPFTMNPYKILGLEESETDMKHVRWVYRQLSLRHHPDKGGDPTYFAIITKAYHHVVHRIQDQRQIETRTTRPVPTTQQQYVPEIVIDDEEGDTVPLSDFQNLQIDPRAKRFDNQKFNQIFEQVRVVEPNDQRGYTDEDFEKEVPVDESGLNMHNFNDRFTQHKKKVSREVTIYKEPEPLFMSTGKHSGFYEFGQSEIDDFSGKGYTDYKKAYNSKFIDPDAVPRTREEYRNVNQLKVARDRALRPMTDEELREQQIRKEREEEMERQRLERQRQFDLDIAKNFRKINRRFIKN